MVVYHLRGGLSNTRKPFAGFFTQDLHVIAKEILLPRRQNNATICAMDTTAFNYLAKDRRTNIDMLEILSLPNSIVWFAAEYGVLLEHDEYFLLSCEPEREAEFLPRLVSGLSEDTERMIVLHGTGLKGVLMRDYGFSCLMDVRHCIYESTAPVPVSLPQGVAIRRLDASHLGFVLEHYHMMDDEAYLAGRISEGMFGAFVEGELAGFIGTHDEHAIGLLEILPEFRRLGLAFSLEAYLINRLLAVGQTPFCQVSIENEPSLALQRKLGLTICDTVIPWLVRGHVH